MPARTGTIVHAVPDSSRLPALPALPLAGRWRPYRSPRQTAPAYCQRRPLELAVFDTPEFSGKLRVSETGDVLIPVAGSVHVAGLTASQAAGVIEDRFRLLDVLKARMPPSSSWSTPPRASPSRRGSRAGHLSPSRQP